MSPRPVFTASLLMSGVAALWMAWAIGTLFGLPQFLRIYMNDRQGDGHPALVTASYVALTTLTVVIGLIFLLLAVLNARGARAARVLTWILAVPAALVGAWALITGGTPETPWWGVLTQVTGGLTLAIVAAALVLLCLPGARAHFRRQAPPPPPPPPGLPPAARSGAVGPGYRPAERAVAIEGRVEAEPVGVDLGPRPPLGIGLVDQPDGHTPVIQPERTDRDVAEPDVTEPGQQRLQDSP